MELLGIKARKVWVELDICVENLEEYCDLAARFSTPAFDKWLFDTKDGAEIMADDMTVYIYTDIDDEDHYQAVFDTYLDISDKLKEAYGPAVRVTTSGRFKMWLKTKGADKLGRGPFEAASVVSMLECVDQLSGVFDPRTTLGEIEEILYECHSEIVMCPACRGLGRFGKDLYCKRCSGTGYVYVGE